MLKEPQELEKICWQKLGVCLRMPLRVFDQGGTECRGVSVTEQACGGGSERYTVTQWTHPFTPGVPPPY